jgi:hypothetical protein
LRIITLDAGELDQVAYGISAEEARPCGDRGVVIGFGTSGREEPPRVLEVVYIEAEVALGAGSGRSREEMQLQAGAGCEPDQAHLRHGLWWGQLGQA